MHIRALLACLRKMLKPVELNHLESELIVAHVLGLSRECVVFYQNKEVSTSQELEIFEIVKKRLQGYSLTHLLGNKEFWELDFILEEDVLSPRPETETIIELLLEIFPLNKRFTFADLGTGTGCIITTVLDLYPNAVGYGCDCYRPAFLNTKKNLIMHKVASRSKMYYCGFQDLRLRDLDLVISNPPYIPCLDISGLSNEVKNESRIALDGGFNGMKYYHSILQKFKSKLKPEGLFLFEIGAGQLNKLKKISLTAGSRVMRCKKDLSGEHRVALLKKVHSPFFRVE